jgi:hypothetical protein
MSQRGKNLGGLAEDQFGARLVVLKTQVERMSETDLDTELAIQPDWRITDYNTLVWAYGTVSIDRAGVWFLAGNLPEELCVGSIRDTANLLRSRGIESLPDGCKAKLVVPQMVRVAERIAAERLLAVIAVLGGRHRPSPPCARMAWDLDDGSHRAIALALSGKTELNAYLGVPASRLDHDDR